MTIPRLSPEAISAFQSQGYLRMPGLLLERLPELENALTEAFSDPDPSDPHLHFEGGDGAPRHLVRAERLDQRHPVFAALMHETPVLNTLAEALMGPGLQPDSAMLFDKTPHTGRETPMHQDAWFLRDIATGLHFWMAIDDCTLDNGCLQYVRGSHQGPTVPHRSLEHPTYTHAVEGSAELQSEPCPVAAGDVIIHHVGVVHGAGPNRSAATRRAISVSFYRPIQARDEG